VPSFSCSAIGKTRNDVSYFNSVFSKFANRAPANRTRTFANFPAFFLYEAVNVNDQIPLDPVRPPRRNHEDHRFWHFFNSGSLTFCDSSTAVLSLWFPANSV